MTQPNTLRNLFVVDTPYQLLNATEAVHSLQLENNHLVVIRPKNGTQDRFTPLIRVDDWETVSFPSLLHQPNRRVQNLLHPVVDRWYCRYLHFRQMYALAKLAARFHEVDRLFLGHYSDKWTLFMRHLANTIKYNTLYLLDDGTDTIEINEKRHGAESDEPEGRIDGSTSGVSVRKRIEAHLRAMYWNLCLADAPSITFFTTYDLIVRKSDRLIKNNYDYLRSLAPPQRVVMPDAVIFLGMCIVDGYIDMNAHLDFLAEVKAYFGEKRMIYVAHPRDSESCVSRIKEHLNCEIWPCSSVIEHDLIVKGIKPKAIAAFPSSALITLASLMDTDVEIVCFHIAPEYWIHWRENAVAAYDYIKSKVQERVTIVPLCRPGKEQIEVIPRMCH
jgi:hypothetical protein